MPKGNAFAQIASLNERSIEMEKQMVESNTKQSDLITNLNEFGENQTDDIAALRANIEIGANSFKAKVNEQMAK